MIQEMYQGRCVDFTITICKTANYTIEKFQKVYGKDCKSDRYVFFELFKLLKDGCKIFQIAGKTGKPLTSFEKKLIEY